MKKEKLNLKKIQDTVMDKSHDVWLAGLGVYAIAGDESTKMYHKVIDTGKGFIEKGKKVEKANKKKDTKGFAKVDDAVKFVETRFKNMRDTVIEPLGFSSHNEVQELNDKVDKLTDMVVVLAQKLDNSKKPAKAAA